VLHPSSPLTLGFVCVPVADAIFLLTLLFSGVDAESHLPIELFLGLAQLRRLVLNHNDISMLPSDITQLSSLELLDLEFNRLNVLPWQVGTMTSLKCLKLEGNPLAKVPPEVVLSKSKLQVWQTYLIGLRARMEESYRCSTARFMETLQPDFCLLFTSKDEIDADW